MPERLDSFPVLAGLPVHERELLAASLRDERAEPGRELARAGDLGWAMYAIVEGEADVRDAGGRVVGVLGPGDTFGEIALLVAGRRSATVVARTPMRLLSLFAQDFQRMRADVPSFEAALRDVIDERLGTG